MLRRLSNAHPLGIAALMLLLTGAVSLAPPARVVRDCSVDALRPLEMEILESGMIFGHPMRLSAGAPLDLRSEL